MGLTTKQQIRLQVLTIAMNRGKVLPDSPQAEEFEQLSLLMKEAEEPASVVSPLSVSTAVEQANFYGVSKRTIDEWRKRRAPLGDPASMVGWWAKTFPRFKAINSGILAALNRTNQAAAPTEVLARNDDPTSPQDEFPDDEPLPEDCAGIGFDATHARMLRDERRLGTRIEWLERNKQYEKAASLRPQWAAMTAALASADSKQIRNAIVRGELVSRSEIEREFKSLMAFHPEVLRAEVKALRVLLDPAPPAQVWDKRVDAIIDNLFRSLPDKLLAAWQSARARFVA